MSTALRWRRCKRRRRRRRTADKDDDEEVDEDDDEEKDDLDCEPISTSAAAPTSSSAAATTTSSTTSETSTTSSASSTSTSTAASTTSSAAPETTTAPPTTTSSTVASTTSADSSLAVASLPAKPIYPLDPNGFHKVFEGDGVGSVNFYATSDSANEQITDKYDRWCMDKCLNEKDHCNSVFLYRILAPHPDGKSWSPHFICNRFNLLWGKDYLLPNQPANDAGVAFDSKAW
ncbi:hypothetical protein LY78DRAFT_739746 [Colletotrichum sublineola]|nr:hypothetical protein LY78DRAFT_739746 [Colletotrichum sublineola]